MNDYIIAPKPKTPEINLDASSGKLVFKGRSIPEDPIQFYEPVLDWISEYGKAPAPETEVTIHLDYLNTASTKTLLTVLQAVAKIQDHEKTKAKVRWLYEEDDYDIYDTGGDYDSMVNIPFEFVLVD